MEYSPDCKVNKEKKMSKEDGKRGKEKKFGEMMRERKEWGMEGGEGGDHGCGSGACYGERQKSGRNM